MKSILFDVDGTLWDSTEEIAESWRLICAEHGVPASHIIGKRLKQEFGKLLADIGRSLFPDLPEEHFLELLSDCTKRQNDWLRLHPPVLYDGVMDTIRTLHSRGVPMVIVSNCEAGYIETLLEVTGLTPYIKDHLCPGDTGLSKGPNIRLAIERNGLAEPVYVGDTTGDQNACLEAGVPFVFASYGFGTVTVPDYTIASPSDLLAFPELK